MDHDKETEKLFREIIDPFAHYKYEFIKDNIKWRGFALHSGELGRGLTLEPGPKDRPGKRTNTRSESEETYCTQVEELLERDEIIPPTPTPPTQKPENTVMTLNLIPFLLSFFISLTTQSFNIKIMVDKHDKGYNNDFDYIFDYFFEKPHIKLEEGNWVGLAVRACDYGPGLTKNKDNK